MLTENADVAYRTSGEPLVDLFYELEDVISSRRLRQVLERAWDKDSEATLKIIWNARSIHLGKSSRGTFYRAVGWLAQEHPATLLVNLPWLVRPLIPKKAPKAEDAERKKGTGEVGDDFELIDSGPEPESQPETKRLKLDDEAKLNEFDIKYGVAHGYWKDLLNILVLAVNGELKVDGTPSKVLNVKAPEPYKREWTKGGNKKLRTAKRHDYAVKKLDSDHVYKALHLSVARLFAAQLKLDTSRLNSGDRAEIKKITLAGKWAPSPEEMHDQHTCIVSSIAEALYTFDQICPTTVKAGDRTTYLKYAREAYRFKTLSPLRKHLQIVERPISAKAFGEIKYDQVPSLAMARYSSLFAKKDSERFDKYITDVAEGRSQISGATLLPSTIVKDARHSFGAPGASKSKSINALVGAKLNQMKMKVSNGQWNTLVQRIRDNGTLSSSIAVCDVSGSMSYPVFADGTCPMDSAIGLSLLLAEVTQPPFGGACITFSANPKVVRVGGPDDKRTFEEKVKYMCGTEWGMNTDFVAVFEQLILPMALEHELKPEEMVKQVFVFSDMQFDQATANSFMRDSSAWSTSYKRIQRGFKKHGYQMPRLIFWNLAGDETAPKPVTAAEVGTALVSGYSQGQLKMFLDNGQFEDPDAEETVEDMDVEEGGEVVVEKKVKKQDPLGVVRKAISHQAYRMLKVVD
ncbi:hypothetical protein BAUCODRAFT_64234 [Baudoinia panamericana UAMH 10762]|uniref:DUF2828 domain-containing protein n=1 Tax=Baudoinia panamericana (strain UAMH 10762) TaxID=717646 RepID=M2LZH4_BAUPA|nr:uncharacterized protein BAUCODRAFT_64234 [Baudoinia panamericana UAMH 10762]EMD00088.1 hypothetical protein BAUCODRAFT_64234 [Baudoinia panamericana UAMH 10762]